ncbi:unnamed protein product, partial [Prorocentrum cordatum]
YAVLLNTDLCPLPGWLGVLVRTIQTYPGAGIVGPMMVNPQGRVMEVGGSVFQEGRPANRERGSAPSELMFLHATSAGYISAACVLFDRELFLSQGLFDPQFAPAYFEDTDAALTMRAAGYLTVVQPLAVVVHAEGSTYSSKEKEERIRVNQQRFYTKHKAQLDQHCPVPMDSCRERASVDRAITYDAFQRQGAQGKDGEKRGDVVTVYESDSDEDVFVAGDGRTGDIVEEETFECDVCDDEFQRPLHVGGCSDDDECDCELTADEEDEDQDIDDLYEAYTAARDDMDDVIEACRRLTAMPKDEDMPEVLTASAHEPGSGVVDTGRGKGVIGEKTLKEHKMEMEKAGAAGGAAEEPQVQPNSDDREGDAEAAQPADVPAAPPADEMAAESKVHRRLAGKRAVYPAEVRPPKAPRVEPEEPLPTPQAKMPRLSEDVCSVLLASVVSDTVEDEKELRVLCVNSEDDEELEDAMLAGGRRELNRKDPKWTSREGLAKIDAGIGKEVDNLFNKKQVSEQLVVSVLGLAVLFVLGAILWKISVVSENLDGMYYIVDGVSQRCAFIERRLMGLEFSPFECCRQVISAIVEWDLNQDAAYGSRQAFQQLSRYSRNLYQRTHTVPSAALLSIIVNKAMTESGEASDGVKITTLKADFRNQRGQHLHGQQYDETASKENRMGQLTPQEIVDLYGFY